MPVTAPNVTEAKKLCHGTIGIQFPVRQTYKYIPERYQFNTAIPLHTGIPPTRSSMEYWRGLKFGDLTSSSEVMLLRISATIALCIGHFALLVEVFDQQWASKSLHKHDVYVAVNVTINLTVMVPGHLFYQISQPMHHSLWTICQITRQMLKIDIWQIYIRTPTNFLLCGISCNY